MHEGFATFPVLRRLDTLSYMDLAAFQFAKLKRQFERCWNTNFFRGTRVQAAW